MPPSESMDPAPASIESAEQGQRPLAGPDSASFYDYRWLLAALAVTLTYIPVSIFRVPIAEVILGVFVLLVAPGYAVAALVFGRRGGLSTAANAAVVVGLSVVVNVGVGLLLLVARIATLAIPLGAVAASLLGIALIVQASLQPSGEESQPGAGLRQQFSLPGFTSTQRLAAYALFAGILVTLGTIGYLSTTGNGGTPTVSLAVVGPNGAASTLPTRGAVDQTLSVELIIQNNATVQSLLVVVNATLVGGPAHPPLKVPWSMPLPLRPGATSSSLLALTRSEYATVPVSFYFTQAGTYALMVSLAASSGASLRTVTLSETIT